MSILPQKYINQFIPATKKDFFRKNYVKKGIFSEKNVLKKGLFSTEKQYYLTYIFFTLSSKYLSGEGAGASPILLPLRMRMYSGKVRTL